MDKFEAYWMGRGLHGASWFYLAILIPVIAGFAAHYLPPFRAYATLTVGTGLGIILVITIALVSYSMRYNRCAICDRHNFGINLLQTKSGRICKRCLAVQESN